MTTKEVLVYLDSQDFINLCDKTKDEKYFETLNALIRIKNSGACRFGVSYLHMAEILNPDSQGYEDAQKRYGETIQKLTDGDCFPFISDAIAGAHFPNDRYWLPKNISKNIVDLDFVRSFWPAARKKALAIDGLNRQIRRQIGSKVWMKKIVAHGDWSIPPQFVGLGFTRKDFTSLLLDPSKEVGKFQRKLIGMLTNPETFCEVVTVATPGENPLFKIMMDQEAPIHAALVQGINAMSEGRKAKAILLEKLTRLEESYIDEDLLEPDVRLALKKARQAVGQKLKPPKTQIARKIGSAQFDYLDHYIGRVMKEDYIPKRSEVRDLLHVYYANHADLVRIDKRMYELLKDFEPFKGKLVRSLHDLPREILSKAARA